MNPVVSWIYDRSPAAIQSLGVTYEGMRFARDKYGHGYAEFLAGIDRTQWLKPAEMQEFQGAQLRSMLQHAFENVPYYRRKFREHGLRPEDIRTPEDLRRLPTTPKDDVRNDPAAFQARNLRPREYVVKHTSGTTGKPLTILWERRGIMREYAFIARHRSWAGVEPREPHAHFGGRSVVPLARTKPPFWRYNAAESQTYFSSYHLHEANLPAYVGKIRKLRPRYVQGFPSSLHLFARHVVDHGIDLPPPKAAFVSTETLLPSQRATIERAFQAKVFDRYGQTELASAITQCERGSYHVDADYGIVEFLRAGSPVAPGEPGEMVATGFVNRATVLIRYETGDTARPLAETCPCGRDGLPRIAGLEGRVDDYVLTPEGTPVGRLDHVYKDLTSIVESQIHQRALDTLVVRVVPGAGYGKTTEAQLVEEIRKRVGPAMRIEVVTVDKIPRGPNGKFRAVTSDIPSPFKERTP